MKNIQCCVKCGQKLNGKYRMELRMGPKGYRSYAVCEGQCVKKNVGIGQRVVRSAKQADEPDVPGVCSRGYDMSM